MQHHESLFPVTGSVALKPQVQTKQARIIAFPAINGNASDNRSQRSTRIQHLRIACTAFVHTAIHHIDDMFALTTGTSKGIGPRYATKVEVAALFVISTAIAALAIIL